MHASRPLCRADYVAWQTFRHGCSACAWSRGSSSAPRFYTWFVRLWPACVPGRLSCSGVRCGCAPRRLRACVCARSGWGESHVSAACAFHATAPPLSPLILRAPPARPPSSATAVRRAPLAAGLRAAGVPPGCGHAPRASAHVRGGADALVLPYVLRLRGRGALLKPLPRPTPWSAAVRAAPPRSAFAAGRRGPPPIRGRARWG